MDFIWDKAEHCYYKKKRFGNQTAQISFYKYETSDFDYWYVSFCIYNKRKDIEKNFSERHITGKCGLEGLAFALQSIKEFEDFISQRDNQRILVQWSDSTRKKIYMRSLLRNGYKYSPCPIESDVGHYAQIKDVKENGKNLGTVDSA